MCGRRLSLVLMQCSDLGQVRLQLARPAPNDADAEPDAPRPGVATRAFVACCLRSSEASLEHPLTPLGQAASVGITLLGHALPYLYV